MINIILLNYLPWQQKYFRVVILLGFCLIISGLYGMHHLLWLHDLDWDYANAVFVISFKPYDANHYLAQLKEIYEGNYRLSNALELLLNKLLTVEPAPHFSVVAG